MLAQLLQQRAVLGAQPAVAQPLLDHHRQVGDVLEGLRDVVVGALAQRVDGGLHRGVAGHQDDGDLRVERARVAHDVEAGLPGQRDVGEDQVGTAQRDAFASASSAETANVHIVRLVDQHLAQHVGHRVVVLDDQHARRARGERKPADSSAARTLPSGPVRSS